MKTLKITPPEGYEIDKEKSTFEDIVFKPVKKELPKSWEELKKIKGYYVNSSAYVYQEDYKQAMKPHRNIFSTEAQAKASIALAQLSQLREVYRAGWVPYLGNTSQEKHCIIKIAGKINIRVYHGVDNFLAFQSPEIRDEFLDNFKDLIEEASPLLFG